MDMISHFIQDYLVYVKSHVLILISVITVMCVWLWSGFYSASIAEMRNRNMFIHFILGLALPVAYPLIMLFSMPVYVQTGKKVEKKEKYVRAEGAPPVETVMPVLGNAPPVMIDTQMMDNPDAAYDHGYFKQIALDAAGNHRGPFTISVKGENMKVDKILECHPDFVMVGFTSSDGHAQKMRIPYKYIQGCTEMSS